MRFKTTAFFLPDGFLHTIYYTRVKAQWEVPKGKNLRAQLGGVSAAAARGRV